jgi:hypothetical protein
MNMINNMRDSFMSNQFINYLCEKATDKRTRYTTRKVNKNNRSVVFTVIFILMAIASIILNVVFIIECIKKMHNDHVNKADKKIIEKTEEQIEENKDLPIIVEKKGEVTNNIEAAITIITPRSFQRNANGILAIVTCLFHIVYYLIIIVFLICFEVDIITHLIIWFIIDLCINFLKSQLNNVLYIDIVMNIIAILSMFLYFFYIMPIYVIDVIE